MVDSRVLEGGLAGFRVTVVSPGMTATGSDSITDPDVGEIVVRPTAQA